MKVRRRFSILKNSRNKPRQVVLILSLCAAILLPPSTNFGQALTAEDLKRDRNRGLAMLQLMKDYLKEYYYDPKFHGMDLDVRFKVAEEKIKEAVNIGQVLGIIAQTVSELNDSHTFFVPPPRPVDVDYGWTMQIIGDSAYVVSVQKDSDAEKQQLHPGDQVLSVDGFRPTRQSLWKMEYNYNVLRPQPGKRVVVKTPEGEQRELALKAKVEKRPKQINLRELYNSIYEEQEDEKKLARFVELKAGDVFIWKLREFGLTESRVDETMKRASQHKALVLDLRGNGGGYEITLKRLVGYFFDREVTLGEVKRRKEIKTIKAKSRGDRAFKGPLAVLVDSESGSAAEIFARIIQLEKRGVVIGDRTAGAVMRSVYRPGLLGDMSSGNMIPYGASITDADFIMPDKQRLEVVGVVPDEVSLPSPADLAARRDPVLAKAVALLGGNISPEEAGALFPLEDEK
jgi:C-terminal processing protease CtpA/Prc